jgi:hypothetical protein
MIDIDLLTRIGPVIYGFGWQTQLAKDLGWSARSMRRWLAGDHSLPDATADMLRRRIDKRIAELEKARKLLATAMKKAA